MLRLLMLVKLRTTTTTLSRSGQAGHTWWKHQSMTLLPPAMSTSLPSVQQLQNRSFAPTEKNWRAVCQVCQSL